MWSQLSHPKLHCLCILRKIFTPANAHLWLLTSIESPLPALPSGDHVAIIQMRKSGFFFLLASPAFCIALSESAAGACVIVGAFQRGIASLVGRDLRPAASVRL